MLKSGWLSILMLQHRFNVDITSIFGCDLSNLGWNSTLWFNIDTTLSQCWIHNINKGRISTLWFNIDTTLSRCCVHNIDRREISTKIQHCPAVVLRLHADAVLDYGGPWFATELHICQKHLLRFSSRHRLLLAYRIQRWNFLKIIGVVVSC